MFVRISCPPNAWPLSGHFLHDSLISSLGRCIFYDIVGQLDCYYNTYDVIFLEITEHNEIFPFLITGHY